jgi:hypothetical protein
VKRALLVLLAALALAMPASAMTIIQDEDGDDYVVMTPHELRLLVQEAMRRGAEQKETGPKSPVKPCVPV